MMVEQMGMSDVIGPRNIAGQQGGSMFAPGGASEGANIKNKADAEIDRILKEQYERGMSLLTDNRDLLDLIAKTLIEEEKINGTELLQLIKGLKPELVSAKAIAAVAEVVKPAAPTPVPATGA